VAGRRARDRRIRQLAEDGWSLKRIAGEVGVTDERVRQILASAPSQEETIATTIRELRIELAYVTTSAELTATVAHVTLSARAKALSRQLVRLEEELEAHRIDRLLGLA
jgi:orotate phosphoribosyltransferase-like protein